MAREDQRATGHGDRMTGGVSLVSKFKVTNLVLVKDEELTVVHTDFSIDLTETGQTPHGLFGTGSLALTWEFHCTLGIGYGDSELTQQRSLKLRILPMITRMAV